ncbi:MAG: hypothetical protein ACYC4L_22355 [Chloroflexota bacterium]
MKKRTWFSGLGALLALWLVLAGCTTPAPSPTAAPTAVATATATAAPVAPAPSTPAPASPAGAPTGPLGNEYSYEQVVSAAGQAPVTVKVIVKDGKSRVETTAEGEPLVILSNPQTQSAHVIFVDQKQAMQVPYQSPEEGGTVTDPSVLVSDLQSSQPTGTETVDGQAADVYEVNDPQAGPYKVWVSRDRRLPLKFEAMEEGELTTVTFMNYRTESVPDSLFEVPADVEVVGIGSLMEPGATPATP